MAAREVAAISRILNERTSEVVTSFTCYTRLRLPFFCVEQLILPSPIVKSKAAALRMPS
ncbi:hypothetical protein J6590_008342 [Homalodisca vitripennis]|nr:hypothetical protein J6590_008342 [Homalodisca vitripennis]